jgi:hypothetical protein
MAKSSSTIKLPFLASKPPDPAVISQICGWADEGEIERAGKEIERQLRAGRYCVEIFKIWLAFRFAAGGLAELPGILRDVDAQVRADDCHADAERAWERALAWLALSLRERMKFHAKSRDATWQRWCGQLDEALDGVLTESLARLRAPLSAQPDSRPQKSLEAFGAEVELLYRRTFGQLVEQVRAAAGEPATLAEAGCASEDEGEEIAPADRESSPPEAVASNRDGSPFASQARPPAALQDPQGAGSAEPPSREQPFRSGPLEALRAKLAAFERLAANGAWPLAAMVARDVEQELGQFDPIRYLPDLFSGYLRTLSEVGAELEGYMQQGGSLESQALERLYRADPGHFLSELSRREASGA